MFVATTRISVLRGTTEDEFGDPMESDAVVYTGLPASILEQRSTARRPVEGRTDNVRSYALRVRNTVTLRKDDRIRDENTQDMYTIDEVTVPINPVGHASTRAVLRKVT